ncbi:putative Cyclohexanone monooxygenase [Seiridium cardinale]
MTDAELPIRPAGQTNGESTDATERANHYEAIVIGAGFSGLRMLWVLRQLNLSARVFEAGDGVGGAWHWNNYPGCKTDCESWVYCLNFSPELCQEWTWKERYPSQAEMRSYLNHVADRFDMRKDISLNTHITEARFDDDKNIWRVKSAQGDTYTSDFVVLGTGLLSSAKKIPFPGFKTFQGESYQTSSWPHEPVSLKDKRVGVIGTGSTGVQIVPIAAHVAKSVHVFQRTPNYVLPSRSEPISAEQSESIKANYDEIWARAEKQLMGLDMPPAGRVLADVKDDPVAVRRVLDAAYEQGGFGFLFQVFDDLFVNAEANETMCEYLREKTRALVKDPKTAQLLNPKYPLFTKRPPNGAKYLESFNKPNVHLVDLSTNGIKEIVPGGIRTETDEYELDVIIYALGFDAVSGPVTGIDIHGRQGRSLREEWNKSIETFQGLTIAGYPNLFMTSGPKSTFSNFPMLISTTTVEIGKVISATREKQCKTAEPTAEAQTGWTALCDDLFDHTVLSKYADETRSWTVGANIPGKPRGTLYFFGGLPGYSAQCQKESAAGFPSYVFA